MLGGASLTTWGGGGAAETAWLSALCCRQPLSYYLHQVARARHAPLLPPVSTNGSTNGSATGSMSPDLLSPWKRLYNTIRRVSSVNVEFPAHAHTHTSDSDKTVSNALSASLAAVGLSVPYMHALIACWWIAGSTPPSLGDTIDGHH